MTERWLQERKHEHFYKEAKHQGYRSRAAYKLLQIQKRFRVLKKGQAVLDIGSVPGGWSQVTASIVGDNGLVIAVDLQSQSPIPGVTFIRGDIFEQRTIDEVISSLNSSGREAFDVVISDASPDISGIYSVDQARSVHIATRVLQLSGDLSRQGSSMVVKVFQGEDYQDFVSECKSHFSSFKAHSPPASRSRSSEIYIVTKGLKVQSKKEG